MSIIMYPYCNFDLNSQPLQIFIKKYKLSQGENSALKHVGSYNWAHAIAADANANRARRDCTYENFIHARLKRNRLVR